MRKNMTFIRNKGSMWLFIGILLISAFLIIVVYSRLVPGNFSLFFNSDTSYLPYLFKDFFWEGKLLTNGDFPVIVEVGPFRFDRESKQPFLVDQ
jgi:hypothetical protein